MARAKVSERGRAERRLGWMLCAPAVIVMVAVTAYPIIYSIYLSLLRADLRFPDEREFIGLSNYVTVLTSSLWWSDFGRTMIILVASVSIELVLGMLVALVMHRAIFGRGLVRTVTLIPYGIVTVVAAYAWLLAWSQPNGGFIPHIFGWEFDPVDQAHPITSFLVVIFAEVWKTTPFMALLLLAGLALVPDELHEAAKVDGASAWQRFWRITVPLMKPAILVALLFRTMDAFRIFDSAYIIGQNGTNPKIETVSILGYNQLLTRLNLGLGSAISVLIFVCVILIALVFIKGLGTNRPGGGVMETDRRGLRIFGWGVADGLVLLFALLPVLWIVSLSLKTPADVTDGRVLPESWSLDNYSNIFESGSIFTYALRNSFGIAAIATVIAVVIASMAAYAIARLNFPGKILILGSALMIAMFPPISIVGPLYNMWRNLGLYDTWPGLIIPYLSFALPLAIYTLTTFFREIPWELEQAAQIDGATPFQAFRKVIVPLAAPGVATTSILVFIFCWNDFLFASALTSTTAAQTVPAALAQFPGASQFSAPYGSIAAAAVIVTIPIIILVLFFQRRIVAGLTAGAVKG